MKDPVKNENTVVGGVEMMSKVNKVCRSVSAALFLAVSGMPAAFAAIIDFEQFNLANGIAGNPVVGVSVNGYSIEAAPWFCTSGCSYASSYDSMIIANPNGLGDFADGPNSIVATAYDDIMLSNGGASFSISQFDFSGVGGHNLQVFGYIDDDSGHDLYASFGGSAYDFTTYSLDWANVKKVMFVSSNGLGDSSNLFALDNIHVSAVPVPPALLMFIPGLLGLGMVARRGKVAR